jgi:hypothetical protein
MQMPVILDESRHIFIFIPIMLVGPLGLCRASHIYFYLTVTRMSMNKANPDRIGLLRGARGDQRTEYVRVCK